MAEQDYFPRDYYDSRQRFHTLTRQAPGFEVSESKVPSLKAPDLFVDYAYLPALNEKKNLVVISSGVHGSEAYLGSAVQQLFLKTILKPQSHTSYFFVHSMNPYGFRFHTRCTENHVNLNRNFIFDQALYQMKRPPLGALKNLVEPSTPVDSLLSPLMKHQKIEKGEVYFGAESLNSIVKLICPGQFENPAWLEYGGKEHEPQVVDLISRLKKITKSHENIVLIDLHTGLGDKGQIHILRGEDPRSYQQKFVEQLITNDDADVCVITPNDEEGFYPTHGDFNSLFGVLALPGQNIAALTFEYGTLGHSPEAQIDSLNRWLIGHQGEHYGYQSQELEVEAQRLQFEKFYPQDQEWKKTVLEKSFKLLQRIQQRLAK